MPKSGASGELGKIVVTQGQINHLATGFAKTWQRPPTAEELAGLVCDRVREEVYCREAMALGLDKDDTVTRMPEFTAPAVGNHNNTVTIELECGAPADIVLCVDGEEVARTTAKMTVPAAFTASESFDVGADLGSTVSRDYLERRPFKFDGRIGAVRVERK
jgi:hypothetical protein